MSAPETPCPGCGIGREELRTDFRGEQAIVVIPTHLLHCPSYVHPPYEPPVFRET